MMQDFAPLPEDNRTPIWFNGKLIPFTDANIHLMTHCNNYGTAVFEGVRFYETTKGTSIFHLEEHIDRLISSAEKFGIGEKYTKEEILQACIDVVKASGFSKGYIRPQIQFGLSTPSLGSTNVVDMSVFFWPLGNYRDKSTLKVIQSSVERISPKSGDIEAKVTGFYSNSHFNYQYAHNNGADDAVMLDVNGHVAEASSSNIFFVKNGVLITPKTGFILKGITRKSIIQLAKDELSLEVVEKSVNPDELELADEIFLTGTAAQIDSVTEYNGKAVGNGSVGDITSKLAEIYRQVTNAELDNYMNWHTFC